MRKNVHFLRYQSVTQPVFALPSLHLVPCFLGGLEHKPVPLLHCPATKHWPLALHLGLPLHLSTFAVPTQTPLSHLSLTGCVLDKYYWLFVPYALSCLSCRDRFSPENLNPLLVLAFLSSHFVLSGLLVHCNRGTPYQLRKPTQNKLQATSICNKFLKKSNLRTLHLPSLQTPAFTQTPFFAHVTPRHLLYELTPKIEKLACKMFRHIDINYEENLQ